MNTIIKFLTIIFCIFCFVSFGTNKNNETNNKMDEYTVIDATLLNCSLHKEIKVTNVEYNNHSYIIFDIGKYRGAVIHDPDCSCKNIY